jgi:oligopeptide/dipeptide ABC transporter ATP-binding protein
MTVIAEAVGVSLRLAETNVITDVTLAVEQGETFAIVGESGAGKTALGHVLLMLEAPSEGSVRFRGVEISGLSKARLRRQRRLMQMIFQDPFTALNPRMRIGETVGEPLVVHGLDTWRSAGPKVEEALRMVGLDPAVAGRRPRELSGGERQRVAIARAVIARPELVVADEPLGALDITEQAQILDLLETLKDMFGLTYVFISRDLPVVRQVADRVAVMLGGRIVEQGEPETVFASPAHPYTQLLLESLAVPDPVYQRYKLQAAQPALARPRGGQGGACPFVARCRHAFSLCGEMMPPLRDVAPGWQSACWMLQT